MVINQTEGKGKGTSYPLSQGANPEISDGGCQGSLYPPSPCSLQSPLRKPFGTANRVGFFPGHVLALLKTEQQMTDCPLARRGKQNNSKQLADIGHWGLCDGRHMGQG